MATTQPETGMNRTGIGTSPRLSSAMVEATKRFEPNPPGDEHYIAEVRSEMSREVEPIGTIPPPPSVERGGKAGAAKRTEDYPSQLVDKLGERLVFERSGVRVYEALISKLEGFGEFEGGPDRGDLLHILQEEYEHFRVLEAALRHLGADPTVLTPSANLTTTMSSGIVASVLDPRTTLAQCLEAALVLELADNECWEALIQMARDAGQKKLIESFELAIEQERDHLLNVREWVAAAQHRSE
jgi:hypothetical protein